MNNIQNENKIQTQNICVICLEELDKNYKIDINNSIYLNKIKEKLCNCIHKIHKECIENWLKYNKSCPLCRKRFSNDEEIINNNNFDSNSNIELIPLWRTYYEDNEDYYNEIRISQARTIKKLFYLSISILLLTFIIVLYKIIMQIKEYFQ